VILTPLYIVASLSTRSRFGATLTGLTMGVVAFQLGDGKYGPFEILKHVAPGLICDAFVPLLTRRGRMPGPIGWSIFGGAIALGRFATILVIALSVQAPAVVLAFFVPGLTVHVIFGVVSGYISHQLVRASTRLRPQGEALTNEPVPRSSHEQARIG
jgi:hypothetical protein